MRTTIHADSTTPITLANLPDGPRYWSNPSDDFTDAEPCGTCGAFSVVVIDTTTTVFDGAGDEIDTDNRTSRYESACPEHAVESIEYRTARTGDYPDGHGVEVEIFAPWLYLSNVDTDGIPTLSVGTGGFL